MRKFVVSDLHGDINTYNAIMGYLESISKNDEVTLYINGDLIDRGIFSVDMLIDIKNRVENENSFKIEYLAGNHEWMMLDAYHILNDDYIYYNERRSKTCNRLHHRSLSELLHNTYWGYDGEFTYLCLEDNFINNDGNFDSNGFEDVFSFIKNLKIYQKLPDTLNDKQIVLAHASCPKNPLDICDLNLESVCKDVMTTVEKMQFRESEKTITKKEKEYFDILCASRINRITMQKDLNINLGNENYFTIIGHTPVDNNLGYEFYKNDNVINIDGGNAIYWKGCFECDHTPLVEIDSNNNRLIILTFNHNNEIIYGTYFDGGITYMNNNELNNYRKYLDKEAKIKKYEKDWFE